MGSGLPLGQELRSAILAVCLRDAAGLEQVAAVERLYCLALLRYIGSTTGCTSRCGDPIFGDELAAGGADAA